MLTAASRRGIATLPAPAWVGLYTALYLVLITVVSAVDYAHGSSSPTVGGFVVDMLLAYGFVVPVVVVPFAAALGLARFAKNLRPWQFRLVAVGACGLTSLCAESRLILFYLPIQVIVALLVTQPRERTGIDS
jgi:hypothetical protein